MNTQKQEPKPGEHEDTDHAQPINLAAARAPTPVTTFSSPSTPSVPTQPLAMRAHMDPPKSGLMTLYFRAPTSTRPQTQMVGSMVGAQVSSAQPFAKHAPDFKNSGLSGWTVIRMPTNDVQSQGGTASQGGSSTLPQGILPSALSGAASRHMIPTAVHPVSGAGPMASIIRGSQAGHVIHQPYSSHVPRGPAAVASIGAAPKSAVATPILRTPHSSATMALASASSMMALHAPVRAKSPTLMAGRTGTPPVASSTTLPQVIDLQKSGHPLTTATHIGLASRPLEGSRPGGAHSSAITIAKSINISQPIVQHLQQVYDKNTLKTVPNLSAASSLSSNSTPAHQTIIPGTYAPVSEAVPVGVVPTIPRSNISTSGGYSTGVVLSTSNSAGQHMSSLRATHLPMHALTSVTTGTVTPHSTFTVISAKSLPQANHTISLAAPRTAMANASAPATGSIITCSSMLSGVSSRPLNTNTATATTIPVAKVYPQQMSTTSHSTEDKESTRSGSFLTQSATSSVARVNTPTTTTSALVTGHQTVVISDKHPESGTSVRFASLAKPQVGSGTSYTTPSATYLYDQYQGNIAAQGFAAPQSRAIPFSHASNTSSHPTVPVSSTSAPVQQLMVAVDSRHHVALHSSYNSPGIKYEAVTQASNIYGASAVNSAASVAATSVVTTTYNALQSNNHTSPRPSILRKRAGDGLCSIAKKNLIGNFSGNEPASPHADFSSSIIFSSVQSPKPTSEPKENGSPSTAISESSLSAPSTPSAIKREPSDAESLCREAAFLRDCAPTEASPRKKPRKQLLAANELIENNSSGGEENNFDRDVKPKIIKEEPGIKEEDKSKCFTFYKRPTMSLLNSYRHTWKSRHNHFARYSDVKPKEEKKATVNELANQKGILQQANGWKVYHLTAQMDEIFLLEERTYSKLSTLLDFMEKDPPALKNKSGMNSEEDKILTKLTDLIKGNLQRSKIVQEQVTECKQQVMKVLDHKSNIHEIVNKYISKRTLKKKDKT